MFTVFGALGCAWDEESHSAFLASLLDPGGDHGQGVRFLKAFLDTCREQVKGEEIIIPRLNEAASSYRWLAQTEHFAPGFLPDHNEETRRGFLDITVRCPKPGFFLVIENKVRAKDQKDQLRRYAEFLRRRKDRYPNQVLVYLTLEGRPSPSAKSCSYVALSYKGLTAWLDRIEREAPPKLRPILAQYRRTVKRIAPDVDARTQYQKDMIRFLLEPDKLKTAIKIEEHLPEAKKELLRRFWENVRSRLEARLETDDASGWLLKSREETDGRSFTDDCGGLKIVPTGTKDHLCLAFNIEQCNNGNRRLRYGLWPHPWGKREAIRLRSRSFRTGSSHGWAVHYSSIPLMDGR